MTGLPELHPHVDLTDADLITCLIADRRLIHQHPEEGWTEFETTWRIVKGLREIGLEPQIGEAVINRDAVMGRNPDLVADAMVRAENEFVPKEFLDATKGLTGAVAVLDTGRPGPTTAFRADIDCVLVRENQTPDHAPAACGFASKYPGLMHACGHDAHASLVLTAARWAVRHKDELCGKLKFIFQPAEEGVRGANAMAAAGVVDDVDILQGGHMGCQARLGELALQADGFLATTKFDVDIEGSPSHAGSDPHVGHNALMAACAAAMMLQGIPRHGRGTTRIAVGKLNAGEGRNVVPSHARMELEVRGSSAEVNQFMADYVEDIFAGVEKAYRVKVTITKAGESTTLIPSPKLYDLVEEVMREVPGAKVLPRITAPSGSEDCAVLMRRVIDRGGEAAFVVYGTNHHGHHKGDFEIQDETSLPLAFDFMRRFALRVNGRK